MDFLNPVPLQQIYGRFKNHIWRILNEFLFVIQVHLLAVWVAEQSVEVFEENFVGINQYQVSMNFKLSKRILFVLFYFDSLLRQFVFCSYKLVYCLYSSSRYNIILSSINTKSITKQSFSFMELCISKRKWSLSSFISSILDNI